MKPDILPVTLISSKGDFEVMKTEPAADTQKDDFCPGTWIWIWKWADNLFRQIRKIKGYKSKYYGVLGKNVVKLGLFSILFTKSHHTFKCIYLKL